MVLELARRRALDRPVAGVVDARRELVREQAAADVEELEREHADVAELVEQPVAYSSASACGASSAGARDVRRIPPSWTFSTSG